MKRAIGLIVIVLLLGLIPSLVIANDVRTPGDCAASAAPGYGVQTGDTPGRGSVCVSDGDASNGNELYVGGDASQPCGRVEVGGNTLADSGADPSAGNPNYCH